jgi:hypothetical protein
MAQARGQKETTRRTTRKMARTVTRMASMNKERGGILRTSVTFTAVYCRPGLRKPISNPASIRHGPSR